MAQKYLIVGDSSGIGAALTKQLVSEGKQVIGFSRHEAEESFVKEIEHYICDCGQVAETFPELEEPLSGLVYLPGTINLKPFSKLSDEDYQNDWNINFLGAVRVVRKYLPLLQKADNAALVFLSTVAVDVGMPYHASTAAAKGAVQAFTKALAAELAPKIRVNVVAPSLTETPLSESLLSSEKKKEGSASRHPLQRVGQPKDIAEAIAFLLSEQSSWISGQTLHVDGGLSTLRLL